MMTSPYHYGRNKVDSELKVSEFVHQYLVDQSDWKIFEEILQTIFGDIKTVVDSMNTLTDIRQVDEIFIPKLASLLKYNYNVEYDHSVNRDIIQRLIYLYKQRGRDSDILDAANYANNPKWFLSTYFYPGAEIDVPTSVVEHPINKLFRHNISVFSGDHRFSDSTRWRDGTIIITTKTLTDKTRAAVKRVLPAGIKAFFNQLNEITSEEDSYYGTVKYSEWILKTLYILDYHLRVTDVLPTRKYDHPDGYDTMLFDGPQVLFPGREILSHRSTSIDFRYNGYETDLVKTLKFLESKLLNSDPEFTKKIKELSGNPYISLVESINFLKNDYTKILIDSVSSKTQINQSSELDRAGFEYKKSFDGLPRRSTNSAFSQKYAQSGTPNQLIEMVEDFLVLPTDYSYNVSSCLDLFPSYDNFRRDSETSESEYDQIVIDTDYTPQLSRRNKIDATTVPTKFTDLGLNDVVMINETPFNVSELSDKLVTKFMNKVTKSVLRRPFKYLKSIPSKLECYAYIKASSILKLLKLQDSTVDNIIVNTLKISDVASYKLSTRKDYYYKSVMVPYKDALLSSKVKNTLFSSTKLDTAGSMRLLSNLVVRY